ncbi:hypothetical protein AVEN_229355-1 [Araneus ventricosus]|uniref:Reverse transcriptase domain-containing protein n=1 Tax=Araneus ventricosus TaxID=182803 RepID=A0A4Y2I283_ARAVE|nr:hypothetical protein AVEN_229355-1 [Araneus ventricosus]
MYCPPSHNFSDDMDNLIPIFLQNQDFKTVILGDFNAKSPIWEPTKSDKKRDILIQLINQFDLTVVNDSSSLPTFVGPLAKSCIDLMMLKNFDFDRILNWTIENRIMFSHQQIMDFSLTYDIMNKNIKTTKWSLDKFEFLDFKIYLNNFLHKCREHNIDFEKSIDYIQNGLIRICSKTKRRVKNKVQRDAIWWNIELEIQRSKTRAFRRRFQSTRDPDLRSKRQTIYKHGLAKYTRLILKTERDSFRRDSFSSLGPVLWLVIADRLLRRLEALNENFLDLHCTMFADDILFMSTETALYKFTHNLEIPIKVIEIWADGFGLAINPSKSKFIVFPLKGDIAHIPILKIKGQSIKYVKTLKYLGVSFDTRLKWLSHFEEIKLKVLNLQSKLNRLSRATWGPWSRSY